MSNKTVSVELKAKIDNYMSNMKRASTAADKFGNDQKKATKMQSDSWKKVSVAAGVGAVALAVGMKKAINAASDLNEATEKSGQVFGQHSGRMEKWASGTANAIGISKRAALDTAATYGNLFTAFGVGQDKAAGLSMELVNLAADLASFGNTTVDQALTAISSGLAGEMEPMKRYGVILSQARIQQKAFEMGLISSKKAGLDPMNKALASHALIMQDTKNAQGDAIRMAEQGAQAQRRQQANFEDMQASVGEGLLPAWTAMLGAINGLLGGLNKLPGPLKTAAVLTVALGLAALAVGPKILAFRTAMNGAGVSLGRFGKIAKGAGIAAAIMAIGHAVSGAFSGDQVNMDRFAFDLKQLATEGKLTGAALEQAGDGFSTLTDDLGKIVDPGWFGSIVNGLDQVGSTFSGIETEVGAATRRFEEWDQVLQTMFASSPGQAFKVFDELKAKSVAAGYSVEDFEARLPGFTAAVDTAAQATEGGADGLRKMANEAQATEEQIKAVEQAFKQFSAAFDDERAAMAFQDGLRGLKSEFANLSGEQLRQARSLDITTEAGSRAKASFIDLISNAQKAAQVQYEQTAAVEGDAAARQNAAAVMEHHKSQIMSLAQSLNLSKSETRNLINQMGELGGVQAKPSVNVTGNAKREVEDIDARIRRLRGKRLALEAQGNAKKEVANVDGQIKKLEARKKRILLEADGKKAQAEAKKTGKAINGLEQMKPAKLLADASSIGPTVDAAQLRMEMLRNVERTLTLRTVEKKAAGGWAGMSGPGYASGGKVSGPGSETSDSIVARLSRNEFVVNAKDAKRNAGLLHYINSGGTIPGFASGGSMAKYNKSISAAKKAVKRLQQAGMKKSERRKQARMDKAQARLDRAENAKRAALDKQSRTADALKQAKEERASHISGVRSSIAGRGVGVFDLKGHESALNAYTQAVEAQSQAQKDLQEATRKANQATNPADRKSALLERAEAQRKLADAIKATAEAKAAEEAARPTKENVLKAATGEGNKAKKFLDDLRKMEALGFSKDVIRDVISKGLDDGSEWAALLSTFSQAERNSYNTSFALLNSSANSIGALDAKLAGLDAKVSAATTAANSAKVKKAGGGSVWGPGTGRSDSIPAMLSNGEHVTNARVAAKYRSQLDYLNAYGQWPEGMALGGRVGLIRPNPSVGGYSTSNPSALNLTVQLDSRNIYQGLVDLADRSGGTLPSIKINATAGR